MLMWTPFPVALREVAEYLAGQTLEVDVETVNFSLTFPRCVHSCCWRLGPAQVAPFSRRLLLVNEY